MQQHTKDLLLGIRILTAKIWIICTFCFNHWKSDRPDTPSDLSCVPLQLCVNVFLMLLLNIKGQPVDIELQCICSYTLMATYLGDRTLQSI